MTAKEVVSEFVMEIYESTRDSRGRVRNEGKSLPEPDPAWRDVYVSQFHKSHLRGDAF